MKRVIILVTILICGYLPSIAESPLWQEFKSKRGEATLPDFSYAGYRCGEEGVPHAQSLKFKQFNITDFGAVANDGKSDRSAFQRAVEAITQNGSGILYIPEGVFDLHTTEDKDESIVVSAQNIIIKGAGRDKTTIMMSAPNHPTDPNKMWTSPVMISIRARGGEKEIASVTSDAQRGSFSIEVSSTKGLKVGDWVNLTLQNNSKELIDLELGMHAGKITDPNANINKIGVCVDDYHQIRAIEGNTITFYEPLLYGVETRWDWKIKSFPHLKGVGIEDLTFEGDCVDDFKHHRTWEDDGAYKPLAMVRVVDSWIRRVNFKNTSECASIISSARVSVYDVVIEGRQGHSAIRAQNSSRVFIGKVFDITDRLDKKGAGQWHAVGVSKHSLGSVLWRNTWGWDGCFEAHATQPRTTLIDACSGAFIRLRQGGAENQLPNHLHELVIWNFEATHSDPNREWQWWDREDIWTKFLPPIVVGYHGSEIKFDQTQMVVNESQGKAVNPASLYEEQLKLRLGKLPIWIRDLKNLEINN